MQNRLLHPAFRNVANLLVCRHTSLGVVLGLSAFSLLSVLPGLGQTLAPAPPPLVVTPPAKVTSMGMFQEKKTGAKHGWEISGAHTLQWEGKPYLPVGGTFAPQSFLNSTDAAWQEDIKALGIIKAKGLHDVLIWPGKSLPEIPVATLQRLIDYLEANDFTYGLAFGPGLTTPLKGTVVKPGSYRFADTKESLTASWYLPDADNGLYVLADISDRENKISNPKVVPVKDEHIFVPIELPPNAMRVVALLYPHKSLAPTGNATLPDLWTGFDNYRDRVLTTLEQVQFGKGFRFFLDPLARRLGLSGETDYLIPESSQFLLEWEGYLSQKYPTLEDAKILWTATDGDFKSYRELARLIPLWANDRGVPYLYDPITTRTYRIIHVEQSAWWRDFLEFRNESIRYYMNSLATMLKKQIADVPVVYTWTQTHPIFFNSSPEDGFDGLSIPVRQRGSALVSRVLGPAFSETEQAARTLWYLASEIIGDTTIAPKRASNPQLTNVSQALPSPLPQAPTGGYTARADLFSDLDRLRRIGIKGYFAGGFQLNPDDAAYGTTNWLNTPESLDWLKEYATRIGAEANAAGYTPRILFYPQQTPGPAKVGMTPGKLGVLWLNSYYTGETLDWWPTFSGYTLQRGSEATKETVLISLQGKRLVHLQVPNAKLVKAFAADGSPVPLKVVGLSTVIVTLDESPTIFQTGGKHIVPVEAGEEMAQQLEALYAIAVQQKVPIADVARTPLERTQFAVKQKDYETAYNIGRSALEELLLYTGPDVWIEGERPFQNVHAFSEIASNVEASNGGFLRLSTSNPPSRFGYGVRYQFDAPATGKFNIWLAGTIPGPNTSPIHWRINSEPEQSPSDSTNFGPLYMGDRFGWTLLGSTEMRKGLNNLSIYVTDRAASGDYVFSIDSLLITQRAFTPNGTVRPIPLDADTVRKHLGVKLPAPKKGKK